MTTLKLTNPQTGTVSIPVRVGAEAASKPCCGCGIPTPSGICDDCLDRIR